LGTGSISESASKRKANALQLRREMKYSLKSHPRKTDFNRAISSVAFESFLSHTRGASIRLIGAKRSATKTGSLFNAIAMYCFAVHIRLIEFATLTRFLPSIIAEYHV
jgi:hypothetical protein